MDDFDDRFEPLTESERAAAQAGDDAPKDDGECVMPVPSDAPPVPDAHPGLGKPSCRWPYRDAAGRLLFEVWRFDPVGKRKLFLPLSLWRDASGALPWLWKSVPAPRPLYGLDRLAAMPDAPVVVCEGEKTADAAALTFPKSACITSAGGCKAEAKANFEPLAGRRVLIWPDADEAGATYAASVAGILHALGCEVSIIDAAALASLAPNGGQREPEKGWDAADAVAEWQDIAALRKAAHGLAKPFEAGPASSAKPNGHDEAGSDGVGSEDYRMSEDEFNAAISKLAAMSFGAYERVRAGEAKRLRIRVFALDTLVARKRPANEAVPGQGRPLDFPPPEPWLDPVNGAVLLDKIEAIIRRFIICSKHAATAMTLWIVATWFEEVAQVAPILNFKSPVHRCGKSTCLAIVGRLVKRRLLSSNTTPAALFRAIEKFQPTLVIDEADSFFGQNEELRGIINSGHTRETAFTLRTVGDELEPKTFSTWGFKAIAGIGRLAVTIEDRSITIELKRKTRAEKVDRLRHTNPQEFEHLSRQLARWASDHVGQMSEARPSPPEALNDRQQDNWDPLFSVASLAGEKWLKKAGEAALAICDVAEDASPQTQLLSDILAVFKSEGLIDDGGKIAEESSREGAGRPKELVGVPSQNLVTALVGMADRPWSEINHGKPLTQNGLARKLKNFDVRPKNIRFGGTVPKGYAAADLVDSFVRYLDSPFPTATPLQTNDNKNLDDFPTATNFRPNSQPLQRFPECIQGVNHICSDVALGNPESHASDEEEEYEAELARTSAMSDAERRAIEAAERAVEVKPLETEAAKPKALPSSKPGEPAAPLSGPARPPILGSTVEAAGSDDDEPKVWEEF